MQFKDHFSQIAASYAAFRPRYPAALFDHLAALASERRCAWDCACGSGQATLELAERFERVVATDASAAQIAAAPPHPRVQYRVAPAEASGIGPGSVDLVAVAQALHWLDLERFYAEVRRVAARTGIIAVWSYGTCHIADAAVAAIFARFYGDTLGECWPPERRLVEAGYRTLPFPFAPLPSPELVLEAHWTLEQLLGMLGSWSATRRYLERYGTDPLVAVRQELLAVWGDPATTRRITWPLAIRVGRVHSPGP